MINWKDRKEVIKFIKFCIVGCINTLITAAVIYVLMNLLSADYKTANVVGYIIGVINSFLWNKLWVFQTQQTNVYREMFLFTLAFLVAYAVQFIALLFLVEYLYVNEYVAQFIGLLIYGVINFVVNRVLTFTSKKEA